MTSKIEWTDETWETVAGCAKVSAGCDNCYAIRVARRLGGNPGVRGLEGLTVAHDSDETGKTGLDWSGEVRLLPHNLGQPLRWKRPRKVFVNSRSDTFHVNVPDDYIAKMFGVMSGAPQHTFQVLTKRAALMASKMPTELRAKAEHHRSGTERGWGGWPLPNVWLGTSIESDRYCFRADHLRAAPAAVRFLSLEPLLGPLPSLDLTGIDWVIVGGESGPGARPMHPDWVRDIRDRCWHGNPCPCIENPPPLGSDAFGDDPSGDPPWCDLCENTGSLPVPFFFKQWGNWRPSSSPHDRRRWVPSHATGPNAWMARERSKNFDGHDVLDGRRHHNYPNRPMNMAERPLFDPADPMTWDRW